MNVKDKLMVNNKFFKFVVAIILMASFWIHADESIMVEANKKYMEIPVQGKSINFDLPISTNIIDQGIIGVSNDGIINESFNIRYETKFELTSADFSSVLEEKIHSKHSEKISPLAYTPSYTPICTQLNINTLYNITTLAGNTYCIYFDIPMNSRTQFLALGQTNARQIHADLFQDIPANYTFTLLGSSNSSGSEDSILQYTEAGHYYYQFYSTSSDGGQIQIVAAVNTNIDQYEPNDSIAQSKSLELGRYNKITAHIDNPQEHDYFNYHAIQGQDVVVGLYDDFGTSQWILEVLLASGWHSLGLNQRWDLSGMAPNTIVNIRVRHDDTKPFVMNYYRLLMGPKITDVDDHNVNAPASEVLIRMPAGSTTPFYVSQVHKNMNWKIRVLDSESQPIKGVEVELIYATTTVPTSTNVQHTDGNGYATGNVTLPSCIGSLNVTHHESFGPYAGTYKTEFNPGVWFMRLPDTAPGEDIGVGSLTGLQVALAQICKQTLQ